MSPFLRDRPQGVLLNLIVQPRASRNEVLGVQGDALRVRLTSPPVEGAANRLCIEFFSRLLGLPKKDIVLVSGDKSRHKRLLLQGVGEQEVRAALFSALDGRR